MGTTHDLTRTRQRRIVLLPSLLVFAITTAMSSTAQQISLQIDPAKTTVRFTLDAALHTVHGTFQAKQGTFQFDPTSGQISGQVLVDAKSGQTGNGMRDRKMNKDVIESEQYPEITFRPVRIEGTVVQQGKSSVTVHGMFTIHGEEHDIGIPARVEINADEWTATAHFSVPYAKWGLKNPSTLFLRVSESVEVELAAGGSVVKNPVRPGQ